MTFYQQAIREFETNLVRAVREEMAKNNKTLNEATKDLGISKKTFFRYQERVLTKGDKREQKS